MMSILHHFRIILNLFLSKLTENDLFFIYMLNKSFSKLRILNKKYMNFENRLMRIMRLSLMILRLVILNAYIIFIENIKW